MESRLSVVLRRDRVGGALSAPAAPLAINALCLALALVALAVSSIAGSFTIGIGDGPVVGLSLTTLSSILLVLITGLGLVVGSFSSRYAVDDPRPQRLAWLILAATLASGIVAAAGTLIVLVAAWLVTSLALAQLLAHRLDLPGARRTLPRALLSLGAADVCLLGAAVIITAISGNVPLGGLDGAAEELSVASIAGFDAASVASLLIVCAALGRCAQAPFGSWLTQTVAAPTPVSALLHAGIVNAGAVLLIATAPLVTDSRLAMGLLFAVAAFSMLNATSLMIARPDVKGALALSTRGQMAFMLLACAMGAFGAAIFHLVAHGMYKATLFLGSGSAIDESRQIAGAPHSVIPPASGARAARQAILSAVLPVSLLSLAVAVISPALLTSPGGIVLLLFAWASAAQASWWWLRIREPAGGARMLALGTLAAASFTYVGLLAATKALLAADLPTPGDAVIPGLLLAPVLAIALAATAMRWLAAASVRPGAPTGRIGTLQRRAYARALSAGSWPQRRPAFGPSRWLGGRRPRAGHTPIKAAP